MPTKKKTTTQTIAPAKHKTEVATHLFLGGAVTLLLVLAVAQFTLSRIMWEDIAELKAIVAPQVADQEPVSGKLMVIPVTTADFILRMPSAFSFAAMDGGYYVSQGGVQADIYRAEFAPEVTQEVGQKRGSDGWVFQGKQMIGPTAKAFEVHYWAEPGIADDDELLSQLRTMIAAIEFITTSNGTSAPDMGVPAVIEPLVTQPSSPTMAPRLQ